MLGQGILDDVMSRARSRYHHLRHLQGDDLIEDTIEFTDPVVVRAYRGWLAPILRLQGRNDPGSDQIAA